MTTPTNPTPNPTNPDESPVQRETVETHEREVIVTNGGRNGMGIGGVIVALVAVFVLGIIGYMIVTGDGVQDVVPDEIDVNVDDSSGDADADAGSDADADAGTDADAEG